MAMIKAKCKYCGDPMQVREADVKRGWGKFCSKSCAASWKERRTGNYARYLAREEGEGVFQAAHQFDNTEL